MLGQRVDFEWDDYKDETNFVKHGIDFETAKMVFDDPLHDSNVDRIVDGEERWQTIGMVNGVILLLAAHTWKEKDGTIHVRIISARKADKHERRKYEEG